MTDNYNYSTQMTEGSEIDLGDDLGDLLHKINKLTDDNEELNKALRERDHEHETQVSEYKIQIDRLTETNLSLEKLLSVLKQSSGSEAKLEIKKIMSEQESKIVVLQQSEQNLKRKNYELIKEVSNLKLENEKIKMQLETEKHEILNNNDYGDDLTKEEAKHIINELLTEIEDLKQEKTEVGEKALIALTEKELENVRLTEEMEEMKATHNKELHRQILEIQYYTTQLEVLDITKKKLEEELQSAMVDIEKCQLKTKAIEDQYRSVKNELEHKEVLMDEEREKIFKDYDTIEHTYKIKNLEQEQELIKLRLDLNNKNHNHETLTRELDQHSEAHNFMAEELNNYK